MKFTTIIFLFILYNLTKGQSEDKINDGASTSSANSNNVPSQFLSRSEACEINYLVTNAVNLLIDDLSGYNNPVSSVHLDFGTNQSVFIDLHYGSESSSFITQVHNILRYGVNFTNLATAQLLSNHRHRREYFVAMAVDTVLDRVFALVAGNATQCTGSNHRPALFSQHLLLERVVNGNLHDFMLEMLFELGLTGEEIATEEFNILRNERRSRRLGRSLDAKRGKCYSITQLSNRRWSELIRYLKMTLIKFFNTEESISWLCDFVLLYNDFKSHQSHQDDNNCTNPTFDSYLYKKISHLQDWNDCLDFNESKKPSEWCKAWRRIMLNFDLGSNKSKKINKLPEMFHMDLKIVINRLWKRVFVKKQTADRKHYINEKIQDHLVCYTDASTLSCPNYCESQKYRFRSSRVSRALSTSDNTSYEREWLKDTDNKLRCRCPEDNFTTIHVTTINTTPKSGNWFSDLFGSAWRTRCDDGSADRNSPRCDELRRKRDVN